MARSSTWNTPVSVPTSNPQPRTAAMTDPRSAAVGSISTAARSRARLTVASATPRAPFSAFSSRAEQALQVMPSMARSSRCGAIVVIRLRYADSRHCQTVRKAPPRHSRDSGKPYSYPASASVGARGLVTTARGRLSARGGYANNSPFPRSGRGQAPAGHERPHRQPIPPVEPGSGSANGPPRHSRESGNPYSYPVSASVGTRACDDGPRKAIGSRRVRQHFVIPPVEPGAGTGRA